MKGTIKMTVARISMVEYVSKEAADDFEPKYAEVAPKSIPEADNLILVRTAETSGMSVAIFKDEQTAENALENRKKMLDSFSNTFKDYWHLQGSVSLNFINQKLKLGLDNS